jgi:hypothetical protein
LVLLAVLSRLRHGRPAITAGISAYILYRAESADVIRQFADEVVPAVRDAVTAERARHI